MSSFPNRLCQSNRHCSSLIFSYVCPFVAKNSSINFCNHTIKERKKEEAEGKGMLNVADNSTGVYNALHICNVVYNHIGVVNFNLALFNIFVEFIAACFWSNACPVGYIAVRKVELTLAVVRIA